MVGAPSGPANQIRIAGMENVCYRHLEAKSRQCLSGLKRAILKMARQGRLLAQSGNHFFPAGFRPSSPRLHSLNAPHHARPVDDTGELAARRIEVDAEAAGFDRARAYRQDF